MKGICFKEPLFHLTVQGIKKQTRRIMKPQPQPEYYKIGGEYPAHQLLCSEADAQWTFLRSPKTGIACFMCDAAKLYNGNGARYKVGEILYLKEPYQYVGEPDAGIKYKYDRDEHISIAVGDFWKNKLFMPEKYARYFIIITDVRAERLQDISEEDCIKEGIKIGRCGNENRWMKAFYIPGDNQPYSTARTAYAELIYSINGAGTWESNPFVYVYDYELYKQ